MKDGFWEEEGATEEPRTNSVIEQIGRYLKNRDYFEAELSLKLKQKDYTRVEIERGLAYFKELGLVRDEELAYRYALSRLEKEGPNKVLARLAAKGVDRDLAQAALDRALEASEVSPEEGLERCLRNELEKLGLGLEDLDYKAKQKLANKLYNKGYDSHSILKALEI